MRYLLDNSDDSVVTLGALTYAGSRDNLAGYLDHPNHRFVESDIRDRELVDDLVADADVVVNFAAESRVDRSIGGAESFVSTSIQGTQTLLDAVLDTDIDRFLQISIDEVYGEIHDGEFTENDPLTPRNPYSTTKAGADLLVRSYRETHNLPMFITRIRNNFGPRQHPEKLIPKFTQRVTNGETLPVYGDGSSVREWIYVEDNCAALDIVLREGNTGGVYSIGSGVELSNLETTGEILEAVGGSEDQVEFVEDRAGHDQCYATDATKTKALGWGPEWSFEGSLEACADYYLGDGEQMADQRSQADKPTTRIPDDEQEVIVANVPLVSVDLVIRHKGGVPLGFRENEPARGEWFIPGGTVFKNETPTDALYWIANEELGVDVTIELQFGTFEHFYDMSGVEGIDSKYYLVTAFEVTLDDDNPEMGTQHSQLKVFESPYEGLHPYVERYLDVLDWG